MTFNFFNISKNLHSLFKGIAGSENEIKLLLCFPVWEEGNPRKKYNKVEMTTKGLITELSQERIKYFNYSVMEGRKLLSLRVLDKTNILQKCNVDNFSGLQTNSSWFMWKNEQFNIVGWQDYLNNNQVRFYGVYGGEKE